MDEHQFNAIKILATDTDHRAIGKVITELSVMWTDGPLAHIPEESKESLATYKEAEEAVLSWAEANRRNLDSPLAFEGISPELESRFREAAIDYCLSTVELS